MKYVQCNNKTFKANANPNTQANTKLYISISTSIIP